MVTRLLFLLVQARDPSGLLVDFAEAISKRPHFLPLGESAEFAASFVQMVVVEASSPAEVVHGVAASARLYQCFPQCPRCLRLLRPCLLT